MRAAAGFGDADAVAFLVAHGMSVLADDDAALEWASLQGHLEVVDHKVPRCARTAPVVVARCGAASGAKRKAEHRVPRKSAGPRGLSDPSDPSRLRRLVFSVRQSAARRAARVIGTAGPYPQVPMVL